MGDADIRYVTTVDGVRIAYRLMGAGEPVVYMAGWPIEHCALELEQPDNARLYGHLARHRTLVRFDGRGAGLSDRDVEDISVRARVLDLAAVVGAVGVRPISLVAFSTSSPVAMVFAARHPELVSRLVLYDAHAEMQSVSADPQAQAVIGLMRVNWQLFTETLANIGYGWTSNERARQYAAFVRECVTPEMMTRAVEEMAHVDVRHLLPALKMPVLVLQHREVPYGGVATAEFIASQIPRAELRILDGGYGTDAGADRGPIAEYLGAPPLDAAAELVTILFTDIVDSTAMTQRLGDEKAQELVRLHNRIVRGALRASFGNEVKHTGDGIMASFMAPEQALEAAVQIQRAMARHNDTSDTRMELRVGVNAGTPVAENEDYFGSAVQLAARVCRAAEPAQILVTGVVKELANGPFAFRDKGPATLRGFEEPIPLYSVEWR